ncbi:MAG: Holliday junction resolvase RuvX [Ruminiclostridium sp.]|nr:Holliday junction resolvase RuvX [Ruminiclostridium sp.]
MRIIGVDYGDSRIGIAVSDPMGWTAQGIETLEWRGNMEKPAERIAKLAGDFGAEKIVVGFPKNMNGTIGPRVEKTQGFIDLLAVKTNIQIVKWDERLSTVSANRTMHEIGIKTSKKKKVVDQIAAVFILQGYLDSLGR